MVFLVMVVKLPAAFLDTGDSLYAEFRNAEALDAYLQAYESDSTSWPVLFRVVRGYIDTGEDAPKSQKKQYFRQAMELGDRLVRLFPDSAQAHLLQAKAYGQMALFSGSREKVRLSREIKAALDRCLALDPGNFLAHAVLGVYYREIADLNWLERKIADTFLGGLPEGTLEMSLVELQTAKKLNPEHIYTRLQLGKTLLELERNQQARNELRSALNLPIRDHQDRRYQSEARRLLAD